MNKEPYELIIEAIKYSMPAVADERCKALNNLVNEYNKLKAEIKKEA